MYIFLCTIKNPSRWRSCWYMSGVIETRGIVLERGLEERREQLGASLTSGFFGPRIERSNSVRTGSISGALFILQTRRLSRKESRETSHYCPFPGNHQHFPRFRLNLYVIDKNATCCWKAKDAGVIFEIKWLFFCLWRIVIVHPCFS